MSKSQYFAPRTRRVVVAGNYGFGNLGDEAILSGVLSVFRSQRPDVEAIVVSGDPEMTAAMHDARACPWADLRTLAAAVDESDAVILGGGGLLHDYSGFRSARIASDHQGHLARYFRVPALATASGKPLGLLALGIGPFASDDARLQTRLAFEQAWLSTVRDTTSRAVLAGIGVDTSDTALVALNAANYQFFRSASGDDPLPDVDGPIAGFFGGIAEWFDRDLVAHVATACPAVTFVLVGGAHRISVEKLEHLSNVRLEGAQPYDKMPLYLRRFDACLVPFVVGPVTDRVDPVKLHEYFTQGKPVVATRVKAVERYKDLLYLAANADEFVAQLHRALGEDDPALCQRRIEHARANSWAARIDLIEEAIRERHTRSSSDQLTTSAGSARLARGPSSRGHEYVLRAELAAVHAESDAARAEVARVETSRVRWLAGRYRRGRGFLLESFGAAGRQLRTLCRR